MEIKQSTSFQTIVFFQDSTTGAGYTGLNGSDVTVYLSKHGDTSNTVTISPTPPGWAEISSTNSPGLYKFTLSTTDTNTLGYLCLSAKTATAGVDPYIAVFEIVANLEADTYARIGAPVGASISADIANVDDLTADAVWDELTSGHSTVGSFGKLLTDNVNATISSRSSHSAADAADAVWDEATSGHTTAGTFGKLISDFEADMWGTAHASFTTPGTFGYLLHTYLDAAVSSAGGGVTFEYTAGGETVQPYPYSVQGLSRILTRVVYSEAVQMDSNPSFTSSALNPANYALVGAGSPTVVGVSQVNSSTVDLSTTTQTVGASYTLTISNVKDLNGNVIV
jgi:hypothetical protein